MWVMDPKEPASKLTPGKSAAFAIVIGVWAATASWRSCLPKKADFGLRHLQSGRQRGRKSGNGLRIFASLHLHATGKTKSAHSRSRPGVAWCPLRYRPDRHGDAPPATVEMGQATFQPAAHSPVPSEEVDPSADQGRWPVAPGSPASVSAILIAWSSRRRASPGREDCSSWAPPWKTTSCFPNGPTMQLAVPTGQKEMVSS